MTESQTTSDFSDVAQVIDEITALKQRARIRKRELIRRREPYSNDEILRDINRQIEERFAIFDEAIVRAAGILIGDGGAAATVTVPEVQKMICGCAECGGRKKIYWSYKRDYYSRVAAVLKKSGFVPSGVQGHMLYKYEGDCDV